MGEPLGAGIYLAFIKEVEDYMQRILDKISDQPALILKLNPIIEKLPLPILRYDDPFLPFSKAVIQATHDLVCGYLFDFPAYLALGGAGAVALERSINYVPQHQLRILHGTFTGAGYSPMAGQAAFAVDAITVATQQDQHMYTQNPPHAAILVTKTAEMSAPMTFSPSHNQLRIESHSIQVTDDDLLYHTQQDTFIESIREQLQARS